MLDNDVSRERTRAGLVPIPGGLLMYGGVDGALASSTRFNDTWIRTAGTWTRQTVAPAAVEGAVAMSRSLTSPDVLLVGNSTATAVWNGTSWGGAAFQPPGFPNPMRGAYDRLRGRAVVVGDTQGYEIVRGAWRTLYGTGGSPMPYRDAAAAYDEQRDQTIVFGGMTVGNTAVDTMLVLGADGIWRTETGPRPPARIGAAMAYDRRRGRVVMFGGSAISSDAAPRGDTWEWDGAIWHDVTTRGPPPTSGAAMAYDPIRERIVMFGGIAHSGPTAEVWEWDGVAWSWSLPANGPLPRAYAALGWNPARRRLTMFGGEAAPIGTFRDTWEWDGAVWTPVVAEVAPPSSSRHSVVPTDDGSGISVVGGPLGMTRETWQLTWRSGAPDETCTARIDRNDNGSIGCADPNCWSICTPFCGPGETCAATAPSCGNGVGEPRETCVVCPADVGPACPPCGDGLCEQGELCAADC